jgi:hypothetical protein
MRKLVYLFAVILLAGATFMTSCNKEDEPQDLNPTINFKGGAGYVSQDATLETLEAFTIGITAQANATSQKNLSNLKITRTFDNQVWFEWDSAIDVNFYSIDVNFLALNVEGTERVEFTITDKDGEQAKISLNITTESAAGPINFYTQKILGSYQSATGSSFASIDGTVYNLADAKANADKIDWLYFYGATNAATLAAPDDDDAADVFNDATNGLQTWSVLNDTRFKKVSTAIDWDAVTDDTIIVQETTDGVDQTKINQIAVGDILGFVAANGKHGLIKIDNIVAGADGTIEISVKVQQ